MKVFLFLLTLFASFNSYAILSVDEIAARHHLKLIRQGNPWTFTGVHKIYGDKFLNRAIMAIENVEGIKTKAKLISMGNHTILEYPTSDSTYSSILFYKFSKDELNYLLKETSFWHTLKENLSIFPKAYAVDMTGCSPSFAETGLSSSSISQMMAHSDSGYWETASSCMMGVIEGIWDSTGGMLTSAYEGLKHLFSDPKGFWDKKVEQFEKLKSFLTNFDTEMKRLGQSMTSLPDSTKAEIFCGFIGGIGTDILIGVLTAGGSLGPAMIKMTNYINKVLKISELLGKLGKLSRLSQLPDKFFTKLMRATDHVADKLTDGMQKFSRNGMDDFAIGYARCAL